MMGERRVMQEALFYCFSLERRVPDNHLLRKIDRFVDLSDLRAHLGPYYSDVGRPSIDPELMIRMLIVGYCFGIRSERRLCEEVHLNLAYRWFCRLGLDADVPDHSTFSKNRHGRFRESDLLRKLFETVVARCMKEGIVGGEAFAVDASIIVADAHRRRGSARSKTLIRPQVARSPNIFRFSMTRPSAGRRRSSRRRSPFTNLSGDPSQDYFADGITENLTTDLSRLSGSFVVARNTAFAFKGKNVDARDIGKELGVRYVLEGSVQRDQNQVRVNAQLIDAKSGGHIWAERFDKPLANLFSMQDDIVASLASRLGAELMANEARRAERTPNPDFMDLYFQGMAWFNKGRNPADIARARDFFERALALDPDNFDAVLGRACADAQAATGYYLDEKAKRLASV